MSTTGGNFMSIGNQSTGGGGNSSGGGFLSGAGSGLISGAMGMIGGIGQANRQYHRQKKLMGLQDQYQRGLNQQGHDLQMDMWNKTNYKAQLEHMRAAGLNPALMYGSAGASGTTGSQGGGSAAGGQAVGEKVMDLQNMLLGAQLEKLAAEKDNIDKDTDLKDATKKKISGVDTDAVKQSIAESVAREQNLNAEEKLKVQQKLNLISEKALTDERQKFEKRRNEKNLTGSALIDGFTALGLDPIGNETDMYIARGMVAMWLGKDYVKMLMDMIPSSMAKKGGFFSNKTINK
jgi:hypothetical protein